MSFRFAPQAEEDIRRSHDPLEVLAEIQSEFASLPPPDASKLASGETDEGALYLLVLPTCGYRVVYQYPRVLGGGNRFLILSVRPGSKANLKPVSHPLPPTEENTFVVSLIQPKSIIRNVVTTEASSPTTENEENEGLFAKILHIKKRKD